MRRENIEQKPNHSAVANAVTDQVKECWLFGDDFPRSAALYLPPGCEAITLLVREFPILLMHFGRAWRKVIELRRVADGPARGEVRTEVQRVLELLDVP